MNRTTAIADERLRRQIKEFIVTQLRLQDVTADQIHDDEPLAEGTLGLDSIDFLELTVAMEKHYQIRIADADKAREIFASIRTLADHVAEHRARASRA